MRASNHTLCVRVVLNHAAGPLFCCNTTTPPQVRWRSTRGPDSWGSHAASETSRRPRSLAGSEPNRLGNSGDGAATTCGWPPSLAGCSCYVPWIGWRLRWDATTWARIGSGQRREQPRFGCLLLPVRNCASRVRFHPYCPLRDSTHPRAAGWFASRLY